MPPARPLVVCLEEVGVAAGEAITWRCVAVPGKLDGLALGADGAVCWRAASTDVIALGVTGDEQLGLWRPRGAGDLWIWRAGRSLRVPEERVVIVLHDDELAAGSQRWRVLLHGPAQKVEPPVAVGHERALRRIAMAGALGLATQLAACDRMEQGAASTSGAASSSSVTSAQLAEHDASPLPADGGLGQPLPSASSPSDAGPATSASAAPTAAGSASAAGWPSGSGKAPPPRKPPPIDLREMPPYM